MDTQLPASAPMPATPPVLPPPSGHAWRIVIAIAAILILANGYLALAKNQTWWPFSREVAVLPTPTPRASASATPDPTAGWKTYTNTQYGFEVKYPPSKMVVGDFDKNHSINISNSAGTDTFLIRFSTKSLEQAKNNIINQGYSAVSDQSIVFNGYNATKLVYRADGPGGSDPYYTILISHGGGTFEITYALQDYTAILSTFKFTDPTAGWKTYTNAQYGFSVALPQSWDGYTILMGTRDIVDVATGARIATAPAISIRHPQWTTQIPRQDIPIDIYALSQWDKITSGQYSVSAAPFPPSELARNKKYVFALPARYNYAFPVGFEEVERIISSKPVIAF